MFGFVKKKDYDLLEKCMKNTVNILNGTRLILLEYKRAEYWKAKALYPESEPYVESDIETVKYIKS